MQTFTFQDIPNLINGLIAYIGEDRLRQCVATWSNTTKLGRLVERFHQQRAAFHWWPGLASYWRGTFSAADVETILLAKDAIKVLNVIETMPASVRDQLASALGDVRNAPSRLFEVSMAHHFLDFGYKIRWIEESGKGIPEFVVSAPGIEFEVECKHFSVDTGRLVSRDDFVRFSAAVQAQLRKRRLQGTVKVALKGKLPRKAAEVNRIAALVGGADCTGSGSIMVDLAPWGKAELYLTPTDDAAVDWTQIEATMRTSLSPHGHGLAHAEPHQGHPTNPLVIMLHSEEQDSYLRAVYETMKDAAKRQLSGRQPALLCIHIPEIQDFASLFDESALRDMTAYFFSKREHDHVYAVSYSSDTRIINEPNAYRFTADALAYRNANCRYTEALQYQLFKHEISPVALTEAGLAALGQLDADQ